MDHSEAAKGHAVERYLLGEMAEPEAESFELHFFECQVCSEELASGAILEENVRALPEVVRQPVARSFGQWWRRPLFAAPAFAAVALAFVAVYQGRELARLNQPQPLLAYTLKAGVRGGTQGTVIPAGKRNIEIRVDLPDASFPKYRCDFSDSAGHPLFSLESDAPAAGDPLSIGVPQGLGPGSYALQIQGIRDSQTGPQVLYRIEAVKQ